MEFYYTKVDSGLGVSSVLARVGGILCPFVLVTKDIWEPMPYVIFGGSTLVVGASTVFLRSTESALSETTQQTKIVKDEEESNLLSKNSK